jgi:hypothetical protein
MMPADGMLNGVPIQVPSVVVVLTAVALMLGGLTLILGGGSLERTAAPPRRPRWLARRREAHAT